MTHHPREYCPAVKAIRLIVAAVIGACIAFALFGFLLKWEQWTARGLVRWWQVVALDILFGALFCGGVLAAIRRAK